MPTSHTKPNPWLIVGALNAALAIVLGAFAAHGLKARLDEYWLDVFQTGVQYHLYHALGLVLIGIMQTGTLGEPALRWPARVMLAGIILFSGSLYLLALTKMRWLGWITPLGGSCFLAAWLWIAWMIWREP